MSLNWVEEIVKNYYQLCEYIVMEDVPLKMPKNEKRSIQGHSDIDVLAINENEICHIECQTWYGPGKKEEEAFLPKLTERFNEGEKMIRNKYKKLAQEKKYKRIFVAGNELHKSGGKNSWERLRKYCADEDICLLTVNDMLEKYIKKVDGLYNQGDFRIGKETGITRLLIHLLKNNFIDKRITSQR